MENIAERFFGLHFKSGVAQYQEKGSDPYCVLVESETMKQMDETFAGKPVFLGHVDDESAQACDGYVVKSFYNEVDGAHWCEFLVTSDRAKSAIKKGLRLSNSYLAEQYGQGGKWHNVDYAKEITKARYAHLAIVPDPRYDESKILTPDEFKKYNLDKALELQKMKNSVDTPENSQGDDSMSFWKKEKILNSTDLESSMVDLPLSKKSVSVKEAIAHADKFLNMQGYAGDDHMVKLNDKEEMSVKELKKAYNTMKEAAEAEEEKKENDDEEEKTENESADKEPKDDKRENEEEDEKEEDKKKKKNEDADEKKASKEAKKAENKKKNSLQELRDAHLDASDRDVVFQNGIERGKELF